MKRLGWDGATIKQRMFSSGIKDSAAANDDRGVTSPPTLTSNARAFGRHRHASIRAFVLGQGQRDDSADCIVGGNSGARGDVHRGRRGSCRNPRGSLLQDVPIAKHRTSGRLP